MLGKLGYSLVETMVITAIVCIVSTFSYPSFMDFRDGIQTQAIVNDFIADLHYARISAIKENRYVVIQLLKNGYKVFLDDGNGGGKAGDWKQDANEEILVNKIFETHLELSSNFLEDKLRFRGIVGVKPGTITIKKDTGKTYKIVVSRLGRLRQI